MFADLIFQGGPVFGVPGADAVAVHCGRIVASGKSSEIMALRAPETRVFALGGRLLLPGFFDAHVHFLGLGLDRTFYVDLSRASSLREALGLLGEAAQAKPGEWVVGRGWDESNWPEKRYLERADLDRVVPRQPCCAVRVDGHLLACNTLALARCTRPEGEFVDRERGHLWEDAVNEVLSLVRPGRETLVEAAAAASRQAASLGITAVADMASPADLGAYQVAARRGLLRTRIFAYLPVDHLSGLAEAGLRRGFGSDLLRIAGVKAFVDGSIGAKTAALFEPYQGEMGKGRVLLGRGELARLWRKAMEADLQVAVHAIGDRAIEETLAAARLAGAGLHDRHRIEHLELVTPTQLDRMKDLGLVASMQPNFVAQWSGAGKMYEERLGPGRDARIDPHAWVLEKGIPLAFGSDGMPIGPLYGISAVLSPPHPPQKIPLAEALKAYTAGAAYAAFAEDEMGRIAPGLQADLVVLSSDPAKTPWSEIQVDATFLAGELVYSR